MNGKFLQLKSLTDMIFYPSSKEYVTELKRLLSLIKPNSQITFLELQSLIKKHSIKISCDDLMLFIKSISSAKEGEHLKVDHDLYYKSIDRIEQKLILVENGNNKKFELGKVLSREASGKEILDHLENEEKSGENLFPLKNILKNSYDLLNELIKNFEKLITETLENNLKTSFSSLNDQINIDIDNLKGNLKQSEFYTFNLETKSQQKIHLIGRLADYVNSLEHHIKYYEDQNEKNHEEKFEEYDTYKHIDDINRLNDIINSKKQ